MAALSKYDWILALISIAFCASSFGNGANDVANSYATSVAARSLTMMQVGFLSMATEFVGAVALGSRVTTTIKNGIISIDHFKGKPAVLMLAMACAETGSATWLLIATRLGMTVSTTQTIVGALIGVGFASQAQIKWAWSSGSVSQIAASWAIAPAIAAGFSSIIFLTIKYSVLEREDPLKWAMKLIPFYLAFTASIIALFIVIQAPTVPSLEVFGAGKATGIILGVLVGVLIIAYVFFLPYFHRRVVKNDTRVKFYHIPLGPLLWKDDAWIYYPSKSDVAVINYYTNQHIDAGEEEELSSSSNSLGKTEDPENPIAASPSPQPEKKQKTILEPEEIFLAPTKHLPIYNPERLWSYVKFVFLQGVTRDCVTHHSLELAATHARAKRYDNRVEHLWTYLQVASAMIMSIAHGSNDVANAVGPWAATYATYKDGLVQTKTPTPVWILVVAGFLLGAGFWFYGYNIVRAMGNRITQLSPTRGYSMELGAAITVLLASRLGLPVSTTQCVTGSCIGVALMNYDFRAVNWKQILFLFFGWAITLPCAGLIAGLLMLMALNTPHF